MRTFEFYRNGTAHGEVQAENLQDAKNKVFASFGENLQVEEKNIDLFETYKLLPIEVQKIILKYSLLDESYENCNKLLKEVKEYGYEFEYGLDAQPFNLKLMEATKIFELRYNAWNEVEFNPEAKQIIMYNDDFTPYGIGIFTLHK